MELIMSPVSDIDPRINYLIHLADEIGFEHFPDFKCGIHQVDHVFSSETRTLLIKRLDNNASASEAYKALEGFKNMIQQGEENCKIIMAVITNNDQKVPDIPNGIHQLTIKNMRAMRKFFSGKS